MAREMKDSGIAWVGEIPKEWNISKVGYFFDIQLGKMLQPIRQNASDSLEKYLCAANVGGNRLRLFSLKEMWFSPAEKKALKVEKGDMLVVEGGDVASCDIITEDIEPIYFQNSIHRVRPLGNYDIRILKYWLWLAKGIGHIDLICNKATIAHFSKEKFIALSFIVIPLPDQHRIAAFLDRKCAEIDSVIADTQKTIEEYKALKQSIITEAVTKGVRGERKMKDSGVEWIGKIADGFQLTKLKYLCTILDQYRSPIAADQRSQKGEILYDYYGASGVIDKIDGYTIDDHVMLIGEDGANLRMRNLPLMYEVNGKVWINNHAHILKPTEKTDFYFLFFALECIDINVYITGSAQPKLSQDNLKQIWVPTPSYSEQREIAAYIREKCTAIDTLIAAKQQLLTELESYKKSVIYEYVTGKKEVL